jgi:hypothetical protein
LLLAPVGHRPKSQRLPTTFRAGRTPSAPLLLQQRTIAVLTFSLALLATYTGPWILQIPPTDVTAVFKDSLAEPSSRVLLLIGCGILAAYGLVNRQRESRKPTIATTTYVAHQRRAA